MEEQVAKYLEMARHCRLLAEETQAEQVRKTLLEMAEDLDAEAERLEAEAG